MCKLRESLCDLRESRCEMGELWAVTVLLVLAKLTLEEGVRESNDGKSSYDGLSPLDVRPSDDKGDIIHSLLGSVLKLDAKVPPGDVECLYFVSLPTNTVSVM
jgi:hypothetical protein